LKNLKFSEPRVLVLGGDKTKWNAKSRPVEQTLLTGVESWVYAFNGNYQPIIHTNLSDLQNYDLIIGNSNLGIELPKSIYLSENRPENVIWVTLIEGSASDYLTANSNILKLFANFDLVNCININSISFFQKLTKTKVEYIGMPFPVDLISKFRIPYEKRRKEILICSLALSRINDILAAKEIGLPYICSENVISRKPKNLFRFIKNKSMQKDFLFQRAKKYYDDSQMSIRELLPISEHFKINNSSFIWMNLDNRYTWGRYILDAAVLQIPIITTKSTGHGSLLFPETCLDDEFQIDKAIELGKRLTFDFDFYKKVAEYPEDKLDSYKPEQMVKKLLDSIS
jgi:hypothetical protein